MAEQQNGFSPPEESGTVERLTSMHRRIHCGATPEDRNEQDELDEIAINNFLDTLSEVAQAIARRREQLDS